MNGSYNDINGGNITLAFKALSGFECFEVLKKERIFVNNKIYDKNK